jgi:hypothetical protein
MASKIQNQLSELFCNNYHEYLEEKLIAFCNTVPDDLSTPGIIYLDECLVQRKNGEVVSRKMITTQATNIIDLRPVAVLIETPLVIYICLKPGDQDYEQKELKKALGLARVRKHVKANISITPIIFWKDNGKTAEYVDWNDQEFKYEEYDHLYNFGVVHIALNVEKEIGEAKYSYKVFVEKSCIFYPQVG